MVKLRLASRLLSSLSVLFPHFVSSRPLGRIDFSVAQVKDLTWIKHLLTLASLPLSLSLSLSLSRRLLSVTEFFFPW